MTRLPAVLVTVTVVTATLLAGCGSTAGTALPASPSTGWVDESVTFPASGVTIDATFRHATGTTSALPAALLIAGSGPTDRNGNSTQVTGRIDTLRTLAGWLSDDGVASLRYDKLGSGQTGLGPYLSNPSGITLDVFEQEATAALNYLAGRPGVDAHRLMVIGHSEGALFTLLLAGAAGSSIRAIGLVEPLSRRYFDIISEQITASLENAEQTGTLTATQVAQYRAILAGTIASLRNGGPVPPDLPRSMAGVFNPSAVTYLAQADSHDPAQVASKLTPHLPVLLTCSDADIQVTCADVDHLAAGLAVAPTDTDFVHLSGVDHVLKQDASRTGDNYDSPLPFSSQLRQALHDFVSRRLVS